MVMCGKTKRLVELTTPQRRGNGANAAAKGCHFGPGENPTF